MNNLTRSFIASCSCWLLGATVIIAQPAISAVIDTNAQYLVSEVFLAGDCFETTNPRIFGEYGQIGVFSNGTSSIGLDGGIILSTGNVLDIAGPNSGPLTGTGFDANYTDPDLAIISGGLPQKDVAILEFEFIPTVEIVTFEYVFASEEYCEFAGTNWNDIFGFFVSGPGINGAFTDGADNFALIPSTNQAVSINTVNHFINPAFYVNNIPLTQGQGCAPTQGVAADWFEYDGFTVPLESTFEVIPCETYTIKLIIADRGDDLVDSAVFLKAGSFAAGLTATVSGEVIGEGYSPTEPFEGCGTTAFIFSRADTFISNDLVVHYDLMPSSTATPGLDYTPFPDSLIIPAGVLSDTVEIEILADDLVEGPETITLRLQNPCNCSEAEVTVFIQDPPPLDTDISADIDLCFGDSVLMTALPMGGFGDLQYDWEGGGQDSLQWVSPTVSGTYTLTVTDQCDQEATATYAAAVQHPAATISGDVQICAGGNPAAIPIVFADGADFSFSVEYGGNSQDFTQLSTDTFWLPVTEAGTYTLANVMADGCTGQNLGSATVIEQEISTQIAVDSVNCQGGNDGAVLLTPNGGTGAYAFSWSNDSNTTNTNNQLSAGDYGVTVTDELGCTDTLTFAVFEPPVLSVQIDTIDGLADCEQGGSLLGVISGGTIPYALSWSNGPSTLFNDNLAVGSYTLAVTDANGCTAQATGGIQEDVGVPAAQITLPDTLDCLSSSVLMEVTGNDPTAPFTYEWTGPDNQPIALADPLLWSATEAGIYTLAVTDTTNNCTQSTSVVVAENFSTPDLAISAPINEIDCNNPSLTIEATEINGEAVSWNWTSPDGLIDGNPADASVNTQTPGWYRVTATHLASGCTTVDSIAISVDTIAPVFNLNTPDALSCSQDTAQLVAGVVSGTGPYRFAWSSSNGGMISNSLDQASATGNSAGDYTVQITDESNGCTTELSTSIVDSTTPVDIEPLSDTLINCFHPAITVSGSSNSSGTLSYQWLDENNAVLSTADTLTVIQAGTYQLLLTNTDNDCVDTASLEVSENFTEPQAVIANMPELSCAQPVVNLSGTAGPNNWEPRWRNANGETLTTGDWVITTDSAGTYELLVQDLTNGCTASATYVMPIDTVAPQANLSTPLALDCEQEDTPLTVENLLGSGNYTFNWSGPSGGIIGPVDAASILAVMEGSYNVDILDLDNGCTLTLSETVVDNAESVSIDPLPDTLINCFTPSIIITGNSTTQGTLTYEWRDDNDVILSDQALISVDEAGIYQLLVTNTDNNCSETVQLNVTESFQEPQAVITNAPTLDCHQPVVSLEGFVGDPQWQPIWRNAAGDTLSLGDWTVDTDSAGLYELFVQDLDNGCTQTSNYELPIDTIAPQANLNIPDLLTCTEETASLQIENLAGSGDYTFEWSGPAGGFVGPTDEATTVIELAGIYEVAITDNSNGCDLTLSAPVDEDVDRPELAAIPDTLINCGQTSIPLAAQSTESGLEFSWQTDLGEELSTDSLWNVDASGNYVLIAFNPANNCDQELTFTVSEDFTPPTVDIPLVPDLSCADTIVTLSGTAGPTNWLPTWRNLAGDTLLSNSWELNISDPDTYELVVFDTGNGCSNALSVVIESDTLAPAAQLNTPDTLTCTLLEVAVDLNNIMGSGNYSYEWTGPAGGILGSSAESGIVATLSGDYTVYLTDSSNGCTTAYTTAIMADQSPPSLLPIPDSLINCYQPAITLTGGVSEPGNYAYRWEDANETLLSALASASFSVSGPYTFTATNLNNNCSNSLTVNIVADFVPPTVEAGPSAEITCADTLATLSGVEGLANWQPYWVNSQNDTLTTGQWNLTTTEFGPYQLVVQDLDNGCFGQDLAFVNPNNAVPTAQSGGDGLLNCIDNTYTMDGSGSSTGNSFSYRLYATDNTLLAESDNSGSFTINTTGTYIFEVFNEDNGCSATDQFQVLAQASPDSLVVEALDASCVTLTGSILISEVSGGTPPYVYSVDGGENFGANPLFEAVDPGQYDIVIQDSNGCELEASASIQEAQVVQVFLPERMEIDLGDSVLLRPQITGNTAPIDSILWTPANDLTCNICLEPYVRPFQTQYYTLEVIDENGCPGSAQTLLIVDANVPVFIPNAFSPTIQDGNNDRFTVFGKPGVVEEVTSMAIFDRWGSQVFSRNNFPPNDPSMGWDGTHLGKPLNPAVFVYFVRLRLIDGTEVRYEGEIILVE